MLNEHRFNRLVWIDGTSIQRGSTKYNVELDGYDHTIAISAKLVNAVVPEEDSEEAYLVAMAFAVVELARHQARENTSQRDPEKKIKKINQDLMVPTMKAMMEHFFIEDIIVSLQNLPWSDIQEIFNSNEPVNAISMYMS